MVHKHPSADLRKQHQKLLEIAFILSLSLVIAAFRFFPDRGDRTPIQPPPGNDPVILEPTDVTVHQRKPPPPKRPPIIVETPVDEPLPDIEIPDFRPDAPAPPPKLGDPDESIFLEIYDVPRPVGGFAALLRNLDYPEIARRIGRQGTVIVVAFVDEEGKVIKVQVREGIGLGCDEAAMEAVRKTRFTPATQRGKPVKVKVEIPVRFRLR